MHRKPNQKPLLIACGVLQPEIGALISNGDIKAEAVFLNKYLHNDYRKLHDALKAILHRYRQRGPVVVYGDLCLGFNGEMKALMAECGTLNVNALNCIDCLLGGKGKLLETDPDHELFFLTPAFLEFSENLILGTRKENRQRFNMLRGIHLIDPQGDMDRYRKRVEHFSDQTGLPVLEHRVVGLGLIKTVIEDALQRRQA